MTKGPPPARWADSSLFRANQDGMAHTVTSAPGAPAAFSSGTVAGGGTYSHAFVTAGTYPYYCTFHGTPTIGMRGTLVAQ